jgi:hypothetical protein
MIPSTTIAIFLIVMSLPALLPRWSHVAWWSGASTVAIGIVFFWLLHDLDRHSRGGDGPAFFAIVLLAAVAQIIVVASILIRFLAHRLARTLIPVARKRVAQALVGVALIAPILSLLMYLGSLAAPQLIGVVAVFSFPLIWLGLALLLVPSASSKPTPLRGGA